MTFLFSMLYLALLLTAYFCKSWLLYFSGISLLTFLCFGFDKWMAIKQKERIPERYLWTLCIVGGTLGAFAGMFLFHHKTVKKAFNIPVYLIFVVQLIIIAQIFGYLDPLFRFIREHCPAIETTSGQ